MESSYFRIEFLNSSATFWLMEQLRRFRRNNNIEFCSIEYGDLQSDSSDTPSSQ